ncbi:hypothetical protein DHEL01_v204551 [Diaporthe helianthi]|uniref:Uncharacterized protein n=1 Tax=Diaporthe helianthi TaxID=158607 RepID=A0A2P5I3I0_DIAHE|nr:hypothetical protein DHEL01_v204551 [Diaporthe helianthi]
MTSNGARPVDYRNIEQIDVLQQHPGSNPKFRVDNPGLAAWRLVPAREMAKGIHPQTTRAATLLLEELAWDNGGQPCCAVRQMQPLPLNLVSTRTAELPGGTVQKSGARPFPQCEVSWLGTTQIRQ